MHPGPQQRVSISAVPQVMASALPGQYNSSSHPQQLSFQQQQQQQQQMQHRGSNAQRGMGQQQFFQQQQPQMFMHQQAQPMIVMGPNGIPFVVPSPMGLQPNMQNMHMGMMGPMMPGSLPAYGMNHVHAGMGMGPMQSMQPMPIPPAASGLQTGQLSQHAVPFVPPFAAAAGVGALAGQGSALPAPAFGVANPAAMYVTSE
jgi:hypothetical protein